MDYPLQDFMDQFKLGIFGFQIWKIWRILKEGKRHDTYYY